MYCFGGSEKSKLLAFIWQDTVFKYFPIILLQEIHLKLIWFSSLKLQFFYLIKEDIHNHYL